ncbi:MAG: SAF domain-containing protein [Gordonia sp. (in: high G+C Gram-positive bacteria)]
MRGIFGGSGSLAPRWRDRVGYALRPGWARSVAIRRTVSAILVIAAVVVGVAGRGHTAADHVLVAARDLLPGHSLTGADLTSAEFPPDLLPGGVIRLRADAQGRTVTGPIRAGEIITDGRLLSPRLPRQLTGRPDARLVPIRLADDAVAALLRAGDVVDVLTADAQVLARDAIVALVPAVASTSPTRASSTPPLLLAMNETAAHRVAARALDAGLAVVLH